jgi:hypothetical protein
MADGRKETASNQLVVGAIGDQPMAGGKKETAGNQLAVGAIGN